MTSDDDSRPLWARFLDSFRGDREMHGWERVLFYAMVAYCGSEFVRGALLPGAQAIGG